MFQISTAEKKLEEAIIFLQTELTKIRTGRAAPSLVDHFVVDVYGSRSPLKQLASITSPDPRTLVIQPWDKALIQDIERTLRSSDLNLSPAVEGTFIRLNLPPLTEENRQALIKIVRDRAEACKISVRQQREKIRDELNDEEKSKLITEDQKFKLQKQLDELVHAFGKKIEDLIEAKETEIMTI